jgi:hypothetical protein
MEATCSFETSADFQRNTCRYIPEDRALLNHRCENLISYKLISWLSWHNNNNDDDDDDNNNNNNNNNNNSIQFFFIYVLSQQL